MTIGGPCAHPSQRWMLALLIVVNLAVHGTVVRDRFVNYDDDDYVTENPDVVCGLSLAGLAHAATAVNGFWHPLTWLSHQLDCTLFGLYPAGHHATNLVIHLLTAVVLFEALASLTGNGLVAGWSALLWSVHPLHVESIAWIAERKGLLSTFFYLSALWAYASWVRAPSALRFAGVVAAMVLGMLAKPMLVTLPLALLLLDVWPLGRWTPETTGRLPQLAWEKWPLWLVAGVFAGIAYLAEHSAGALSSGANIAFTDRLANAVISLATYLRRIVLPFDLAVFYPHPVNRWTIPALAGSATLLFAVGVVSVGMRRRAPVVPFAAAWFVITLLPVLGLIQVGRHAMADRYTDVPMMGPMLLIGWCLAGGPQRVGIARLASIATGVLLASAWGGVAIAQHAHWRDSARLFTHAIAVTSDNDVAHYNLGCALVDQKRLSEARDHFLSAAQINDSLDRPHAMLGKIALDTGDLAQARLEFERALELRPRAALNHNNLATVLSRLDRVDDAVRHLRTAIQLDPEYAQARINLAVGLASQGRVEDAIDVLQAADRLRSLDAANRQLLEQLEAFARQQDAANPIDKTEPR